MSKHWIAKAPFRVYVNRAPTPATEAINRESAATPCVDSYPSAATGVSSSEAPSPTSGTEERLAQMVRKAFRDRVSSGVERGGGSRNRNSA